MRSKGPTAEDGTACPPLFVGGYCDGLRGLIYSIYRIMGGAVWKV